MGEDRVATFNRLFEAFVERDEATLRELFHADAVWYPALGALANRASYRGPEAIRRFLFEELPEVLEGFTGELLGVRDLGDDALLAEIRLRGRLVRADMDVEQTFAYVCRFRDGRLAEVHSYPSVTEALEGG